MSDTKVEQVKVASAAGVSGPGEVIQTPTVYQVSVQETWDKSPSTIFGAISSIGVLLTVVATFLLIRQNRIAKQQLEASLEPCFDFDDQASPTTYYVSNTGNRINNLSAVSKTDGIEVDLASNGTGNPRRQNVVSVTPGLKPGQLVEIGIRYMLLTGEKREQIWTIKWNGANKGIEVERKE